MSEWQPIETVPEKEWVILFNKNVGIVVGKAFKRKKTFDACIRTNPNSLNARGGWMRPTHWMPLPEPPK